MTITAAGLIRNEGYDVDLFDVGLRSSADEIEEVLDTYEPDYLVVFDDGFNYLTKMCLTTMREAAFKMQQFANERGIKVITCSSDSTDHYEKYLIHGAHYVIRGEGEITLLELINGLDNGVDVKNILGISYLKGDEIITTSKRPVNTQLDQLPQAAWDLVDIDVYRKVWEGANKKFHLNLATTRGCPYKCNWCAKPIYGNRYNTRDPKLVVDEIEMLVTTTGADHFWMCDDIFGLKPGWVQEFRDELNRRNIQIKYKIQSRADLLLQEDNIDALVASGLAEAWIGAESGSQVILDAMDKGTTVDQIRESSSLLKDKGVTVALFVQFGYLGETKKDIDKTIDLVLDIMPDKIGASVSYPLPGTKFYDKVKSDLTNKTNWSDSDDLDMMFKNTYSPAFYKKLHRYLHNRHRVKRGWLSVVDLIMRPWSMNSRRLRNVFALGLHIPLSLINRYKLNKMAVQNV